MSAKAKRIGKCIFDIHLYITVSYIIQVTLFIRHLITNSLMDQAFLKFFTQVITSTAPAAPRRCPVIDFVEFIFISFACSPNVFLMAIVSNKSL